MLVPFAKCIVSVPLGYLVLACPMPHRQSVIMEVLTLNVSPVPVQSSNCMVFVELASTKHDCNKMAYHNKSSMEMKGNDITCYIRSRR